MLPAPRSYLVYAKLARASWHIGEEMEVRELLRACHDIIVLNKNDFKNGGLDIAEEKSLGEEYYFV